MKHEFYIEDWNPFVFVKQNNILKHIEEETDEVKYMHISLNN